MILFDLNSFRALQHVLLKTKAELCYVIYYYVYVIFLIVKIYFQRTFKIRINSCNQSSAKGLNAFIRKIEVITNTAMIIMINH